MRDLKWGRFGQSILSANVILRFFWIIYTNYLGMGSTIYLSRRHLLVLTLCGQSNSICVQEVVEESQLMFDR